MNAELISIGDELLIGQVVNTNVAYLSQKLGEIGVSVNRITTIGDEKRAILRAFREAWKSHDVVIVTGGLGPTHDDISKAVVAQFFERELVMHAATLRAVKARFKKFGYAKMPESNVGQALVPKGATVLKNDAGTAPGLLIHEDGKTFVILPGVPREMKWIVEHGMLAWLKKTYAGKLRGVIHHRTLITTGIGESSLAELLAPIDELLEQDTTLAFLPNVPLLRLRITARGATNREVLKRIATMEARIRAKAAKYIIGVDDDTLEAIVANILIEQKKTLAVAESCTGGMLSSRLTTISGVGEVFLGGVVSYDNSIKTDVLGVSASTIEQYGAVSEETALEMASGIRKETKADIGISITGLAGPTGGGEHKPIGTVWIALADEGGVRAYHNLFSGDRQLIRERSTVTALNLLRRLLLREAE